MTESPPNTANVLKKVQFALRKLSATYMPPDQESNNNSSASWPNLNQGITLNNGTVSSDDSTTLEISKVEEDEGKDDDDETVLEELSYIKKYRNRSSRRRMSSDSGFSIQSDSTRLTWATTDEGKQALVSVLSGLYAMVLIILSLAFEFSMIIVESASTTKYDLFYIYLYGTALIFFIYCYGYLLKANTWKQTCVSWCCWIQSKPWRKKNPDFEAAIAMHQQNKLLTRSASQTRKVTHSAPSAGTLYLRMGCVIFGVVGLIAKGLQLFSGLSQIFVVECSEPTLVAETALVMAFLFVQMFFIFQNNKLVIHRFKSIGQIGLMHMIATNLCTWIRNLVQEQYHVIEVVGKGIQLSASHRDNDILAAGEVIHIITNGNITLRHGSVDFRDYVFATNISNPCYQYTHQRNTLITLISDVKPFMITCLIEYSLICAAVMYILWRNVGHVIHEPRRSRKHKFHVDCSSSTRGLFMGLLFMVFTIISMIIFFTKMRSDQNHQALWVFYASDSILIVVSILALVIAHIRIRRLYYAPDQKNTLLLDDILLIVGLVGQLMFCVFSVVPLNSGSLTASMIIVTSLLRMVEVLLQTILIFFGQRVALLGQAVKGKNPGRELVTFLLLTNLSMFLINTFETQKAGSNPLMAEFYGESIWTVIVYSTVPLSIFYRFHSTVCLAEIWKHAYRVKTVVEAC